MESCRASPPHGPREGGLTHPSNTSRSNLAVALGLFEVAFRTQTFCVTPGDTAQAISDQISDAMDDELQKELEREEEAYYDALEAKQLQAKSKRK